MTLEKMRALRYELRNIIARIDKGRLQAESMSEDPTAKIRFLNEGLFMTARDLYGCMAVLDKEIENAGKE